MKQGQEFFRPDQQTRTATDGSAESNANTVDLTVSASTLYRTTTGLGPVTSYFLAKMYRRVAPDALTNSERVSATEVQAAWVSRDTRRLHEMTHDKSVPGWARRAVVAETCFDSISETYAGPAVGRVAMSGEAVHLALAAVSAPSAIRRIALPWPPQNI